MFYTESNTFTHSILDMNSYLLYINEWFDLPQLSTISTGNHSFYGTASLTIESIQLLIIIFDYPALSSILIGEHSFYQAKTVTIKSTFQYVFFIGSSSIRSLHVTIQCI